RRRPLHGRKPRRAMPWQRLPAALCSTAGIAIPRTLEGRVHTMKLRVTLSALVAALLVAAGGAAQEGWKEVTWKEGKCSLLLPGKPTEKKDILQVADKQGVYVVYFADTPDMAKADAATIKQVFDKARDALVASLKGKLLSEKDVKLDKYAGRELQ